MKRFLILPFLILLSFYILSQNTVPKQLNKKKKIGYISFDEKKDNKHFFVCDELNIQEYYQVKPNYKEGIFSIKNYFDTYIKKLNLLCKTDGLITIRFLINCKGETDRFRSFFIDNDYKENHSNQQLIKALIEGIKNMGNWNAGMYRNKNYDCYQNLKFRIKNKKINDILF